MNDYLLDAMNEISDEHICEAVNYEAKDKKLSLKKLIPIAACIVFVIVAVISGKSLFEVATPNVTVATIVGGDTDATMQEPTMTTSPVYCPTLPAWESLNYGNRFNKISYDNCEYNFAHLTKSADSIGEYLFSTEVKRDYKIGESYNATAEAYAFDSVSPEAYVSVKFTEDESEEYFVYYNADYFPETLEDYLDDIDAQSNLNFIGDTAEHRYETLKGELIKKYYNIDAKAHKELFSLLWGKRDSVCYDRNLNDKNSEWVVIETHIMGDLVTFLFCDSGVFDVKAHLYVIYSDNRTYCFDIGEETFRRFIGFLESETEMSTEVHYHNGTTKPKSVSDAYTTTSATTLPYQPIE